MAAVPYKLYSAHTVSARRKAAPAPFEYMGSMPLKACVSHRALPPQRLLRPGAGAGGCAIDITFSAEAPAELLAFPSSRVKAYHAYKIAVCPMKLSVILASGPQ